MGKIVGLATLAAACHRVVLKKILMNFKAISGRQI